MESYHMLHSVSGGLNIDWILLCDSLTQLLKKLLDSLSVLLIGQLLIAKYDLGHIFLMCCINSSAEECCVILMLELLARLNDENLF